MTDPSGQAPANGVEPCRECGAPLAVDQRYCLNCGRRRGEPRLDLRRHMTAAGGAAAAPQAAPAVASAPPSEERKQRDFAPLAAAGGIAVLGLMLLVGVLIGRGENSATTPAPAPVVRVEGETGDRTAAQGGLNLDEKAKSKGGGKAGGGGEKAASPAVTASDEELKALQEQSPQEYSESSAKLPDEIATGGKAPPKDNKDPGGGSAGTTVE